MGHQSPTPGFWLMSPYAYSLPSSCPGVSSPKGDPGFFEEGAESPYPGPTAPAQECVYWVGKKFQACCIELRLSKSGN